MARFQIEQDIHRIHIIEADTEDQAYDILDNLEVEDEYAISDCSSDSIRELGPNEKTLPLLYS